MKVLSIYTFLNASCKPGDNVIAAAMVDKSSIKAYIIRLEVEFLHDGHAEQHREHAALPQQHAS